MSLKKIQHEAARIVTGGTKLISISSVLSETGLGASCFKKTYEAGPRSAIGRAPDS